MPEEFEVPISVQVSSGGFDGAERSVASLTERIFSLRGAALAAGAALGYLGTKAIGKAISAASEFEDAMVEVQKVTDPDKTNVPALNDAIRDMAPELRVAQDELASMAAQGARLGISGTENLKEFITVTSQMAVATELSTDKAAKAFAKLVAQTDASAKDMRGLGAAVNQLSNQTEAGADDIVTAATRSGVSLTRLGLSADEVIALNGAIAGLGASARRTGTRLRRLPQQIMDPKKTEDLAGAMGMTVDQFKAMREENPTKLMLLMAKRFRDNDDAARKLSSTLASSSTVALNLMAQNLDQVKESLETAGHQFEEGGSLIKEFELAAATFSSRLKETKLILKNIAITTGEFLLPRLKQLLELINPLLKGFQDMNEATDGLLGTLTAATAAVGGLGVAMSAFLNIFGLAGSGGVVGAAATALSIFGNVVFVALAAVTAFVAVTGSELPKVQSAFDNAFGGAVSELQAFIRFLQGTLQNAARGAQEFWQKWGDEFLATAAAVSDALGEIFGLLKDLIVPPVRAAMGAVQSIWRATGDTLIGTTLAAIQTVARTVEAGVADIRTVVQGATAKLEALWAAHGDEVIATIRGTVGRVVGVFERLAGGLRSALQAAREEVILFIASLRFNLLASGGPVNRALAGFLGIFHSALFGDFRGALESAKGFVEDFAELVGIALGHLARLWDRHSDTVLAVARGAYQVARNIITIAIEAIRDAVVEALDLIDKALREGRKLWEKYRQTIKLGLGIVLSFLTGTFLTKILGVFRLIKGALSGGGTSWENFASDVMSVLGDIKEVAEDVFENFLIPLFGRLKETVERHLGPIISELKELRGTFASWGDEIKGIVEAAFGALGGIVATSLDTVGTSIRIALNIINGDWQEAWDVAAAYVDRRLTDIQNAVDGVDWVKLGDTILGGIVDGLSFAAAKAGPVIDEAISVISETVREVDWWQVGRDIGDLIVKGIKTLLEGASDIDWAKAGKAILRGIAGGLIITGEILGGIGQRLLEFISQEIREINWKQLGNDIISGIEDGITQSGNLGQKIRNSVNWNQLGKDIVNAIKTGMDTAGDISGFIEEKFNQTNWNQLGKDIASSIATGIRDAGAAFGRMVSFFRTNFSETVKQFSWKEVGRALASVIATGWEQSGAVFGGMVKTFKNKFSGSVKNTDWSQTARDLVLQVANAIAQAGDAFAQLLGGWHSRMETAIRNTDWQQVGRTLIKLLGASILVAIEAQQTFIEVGLAIGEAIMNTDWVKLGKDIVGFVAQGIELSIHVLIEVAKGMGKEIWDHIKNTDWVKLGNDVLRDIGVGLKMTEAFLQGAVTKAVNFIQDTVAKVETWVQVGKDILKFIAQGLGALGSLLGSAATGVGNFIDAEIRKINWVKLGKDILKWIANGLGFLAGLVGSAATGVADFIWTKISEIDWVGHGKQLLKWIAQGLGFLASLVGGAAIAVADFIWTKITETDWIQLGKDLLSWIADGLGFLVSLVGDAALAVATFIWDKITETDWLGLGKKLLGWIADGLGFLATMVADAATGVGEFIWNKITETDWVQLGKDIIDWIAEGLENVAHKLATKAENLGDKIVSGIQNEIDKWTPSWPDLDPNLNFGGGGGGGGGTPGGKHGGIVNAPVTGMPVITHGQEAIIPLNNEGIGYISAAFAAAMDDLDLHSVAGGRPATVDNSVEVNDSTHQHFDITIHAQDGEGVEEAAEELVDELKAFNV